MQDVPVTTDGILFFLTLLSTLFGAFIYFNRQREAIAKEYEKLASVLASLRQEVYEKFSLKSDIATSFSSLYERMKSIEDKLDRVIEGRA